MSMTVRERAALDGERTYPGGPCSKCGSSERYVSNGDCVACVKRRSRERKARIRELQRQGRVARGEGEPA